MGHINSEDEDTLVAKNSMPEDDPNGNTLHDAREIRWGPQHAGAKLLASQYTKGKCSRLSEPGKMLTKISSLRKEFHMTDLIARYFARKNLILI